MDRGPLPPHERTWRHPSELAAEERAVLRAKEAAPSTRVFALTTGTLGLLAVGVLILTVTPRRQESPIAVSATTTAAAVAAAGDGDTGVRPSALAPGFATRNSPTTGAVSGRSHAAQAIPIGDGHLVVVTRASLGESDGAGVDLVLPSGQTAVGNIVHGSDDALVLAVEGDAEPGHAIARHRPHERDMVTVMASPPITVAYGDIHDLDVREGTAVLDRDGSLVAVCSESDHGVRVIEITEEFAGATTAGR